MPSFPAKRLVHRSPGACASFFGQRTLSLDLKLKDLGKGQKAFASKSLAHNPESQIATPRADRACFGENGLRCHVPR